MDKHVEELVHMVQDFVTVPEDSIKIGCEDLSNHSGTELYVRVVDSLLLQPSITKGQLELIRTLLPFTPSSQN